MDDHKRSQQCHFDAVLASGYPLLAAYFQVGDPRTPLSRLKAYAQARVDCVELALKTDRPFADGPIVAGAMRRARGTGLLSDARDAAQAIGRFERPTASIAFGYDGPALQAAETEWRTVDALLCLGRIRQGRKRLQSRARRHGVKICGLVRYDMPEPDLRDARSADGYVMLQYTPGRTGLRGDTDARLASRMRRLREAGIRRPILAGIGISTPDQARHALDCGADGVVVGSAAVLKGLEGRQALTDYLSGIRQVLDGH